jgi:hypothetical protein
MEKKHAKDGDRYVMVRDYRIVEETKRKGRLVVGNMTIRKEEVRELVAHLSHWLETGRLFEEGK